MDLLECHRRACCKGFSNHDVNPPAVGRRAHRVLFGKVGTNTDTSGLEPATDFAHRLPTGGSEFWASRLYFADQVLLSTKVGIDGGQHSVKLVITEMDVHVL